MDLSRIAAGRHNEADLRAQQVAYGAVLAGQAIIAKKSEAKQGRKARVRMRPTQGMQRVPSR